MIVFRDYYSRPLNEKQHRLLDRIADRDPKAKVVGWDAVNIGPIIRHEKGSLGVARPSGREVKFS